MSQAERRARAAEREQASFLQRNVIVPQGDPPPIYSPNFETYEEWTRRCDVWMAERQRRVGQARLHGAVHRAIFESKA